MPDPISRRESLKKAAGALALSLGAPAALAAEPSDPALRHFKMTFYKEASSQAAGSIELPHDIVDKLVGEDGLIIIKRVKFDRLDREVSQTFDVRSSGG